MRPKFSEPGCVGEAHAGETAKTRLLYLLNAGRFTLIAGRRDEDRFGRKLRVLARNDISLGEMLVREGLARRWGGPSFDGVRETIAWEGVGLCSAASAMNDLLDPAEIKQWFADSAYRIDRLCKVARSGRRIR